MLKKKYNLFTLLCFIIVISCREIYILIPPEVFSEVEEKNKLINKFVYDGLNIDDPFISLFDKAKQSKENGSAAEAEEEFLNRLKKINVNGILWDEKMPLVMIDNKIFTKSTTVEGVLIQDITAGSVIFSYNGLVEEISFVKKENLDVQGGLNENNKKTDVE